MEKERDYSLDLIRIIAIFMVVMIHSAAKPLVSSVDAGGFNFTISNLLDSISRPAVPLFLMISGACCLDEKGEFTIKKAVTKALTFLAIFLIWSLIYAVRFQIIDVLQKGNEINWKSFFEKFAFGHSYLWFIPLIIGLYLITPLLRYVVKKENKNAVLYLMGILFFFTVLKETLVIFLAYDENVSYVIKWINMFKLDYTASYLLFFIAGWYLKQFDLGKGQRIGLYILGFASLVTMFLLTEIKRDSFNETYSNSNMFVFFYAVAIFDVVSRFYKGNATLNKIVLSLSKLTFGVYVTHIFFVDLFKKQFLASYENALGPILLIFVCTIGCSFALSFVISRIPFVKKIIHD